MTYVIKIAVNDQRTFIPYSFNSVFFLKIIGSTPQNQSNLEDETLVKSTITESESEECDLVSAKST